MVKVSIKFDLYWINYVTLEGVFMNSAEINDSKNRLSKWKELSITLYVIIVCSFLLGFFTRELIRIMLPILGGFP